MYLFAVAFVVLGKGDQTYIDSPEPPYLLISLLSPVDFLNTYNKPRSQPFLPIELTDFQSVLSALVIFLNYIYNTKHVHTKGTHLCVWRRETKPCAPL